MAFVPLHPQKWALWAFLLVSCTSAFYIPGKQQAHLPRSLRKLTHFPLCRILSDAIQ